MNSSTKSGSNRAPGAIPHRHELQERGVYVTSSPEENRASGPSRLPAPVTLKRAEARAPRAGSRRRAFTLLEVMIAVGVLFMCLFAVLALLSNSLASARRLQQHRDIDTSSIAGMIYVQLINTNSVNEGPVDVDLEEMYPGSKCRADLTQVASNGLCQIDFEVDRNSRLEAQSHFLIYLPNFKQGMSRTLQR